MSLDVHSALTETHFLLYQHRYFPITIYTIMCSEEVADGVPAFPRPETVPSSGVDDLTSSMSSSVELLLATTHRFSLPAETSKDDPERVSTVVTSGLNFQAAGEKATQLLHGTSHDSRRGQSGYSLAVRCSPSPLVLHGGYRHLGFAGEERPGD
jgi:hypothetical protein